MTGLPERWWFRHDENDALQKRFNKHESKAHLKVLLAWTTVLLHALQALHNVQKSVYLHLHQKDASELPRLSNTAMRI